METNSEETFLVADTSILVGALPFIRAVIESEELPYVVYIPYVVLTELDKGRTAAPVNQLISRYMRQQSMRLLAQNGTDHDKVFVAKGIVVTNDDLIMGAALQLKETDRLAYEILDQATKKQLASKTMLRKVKEIMRKCREKAEKVSIDEVRRLIKYACAISEQVKTKNILAVKVLNIYKGIYAGIKTSTRQTYALNFDHLKNKQVGVSELGLYKEQNNTTKIKAGKLQQQRHQSTRNTKKKPKQLEEDTRHRRETYHRMLEDTEISDEDILPFDTDSTATVNLIPQLENNSVSRRLTRSKETIATETLVRTSMKYASKHEIPTNCQVLDSEADSDKLWSSVKQATKRSFERPAFNKAEHNPSAQLSNANFHLLFERHEDSSRMDTEESVAVKRQRQIESRSSTIISDKEPVYEMLNSAWQHLNNITGSWASYCKIEYPFAHEQKSPDPTYDHPHLNRWSQVVAQVSDFYERLLKINCTVSKSIQMEVAGRFKENISKIWGPLEHLPCSVRISSPAEILSFFEDDHNRELMSNGLEQLKTFRRIIQQCDKKLVNELFQRTKKRVCRSSAKVTAKSSKSTDK
ncbi:uncharacterized protein LOC111265565 isoform X2 [Varroa jacobsoni]|uniref:uncharacterized protein LOC111265565 isoform X2 n=1 Tax=Varroa jacobsoni TaxID=62625 RepID=UPI000BF74172|nr:uncharacterized protein LOC111265565 isoform X2 [Varroa jacobsoni]